MPSAPNYDLIMQFVLSSELRGGKRLNRPHITAAHQPELAWFVVRVRWTGLRDAQITDRQRW